LQKLLFVRLFKRYSYYIIVSGTFNKLGGAKLRKRREAIQWTRKIF